jgi:hypothetical protein
VNLSLIVIGIIASSFAVGYVVGVDDGIARAKRAAIETCREMHNTKSFVSITVLDKNGKDADGGLSVTPVDGATHFNVYRHIDEHV